ncbi:hypothetical protein [Limosilactobacillus portuensis]|uniref:hypothetical protein n=2 Tax=Limosilactobacillus portuensis TaxID=2742601 RepID=UPI0032676331
MAKTSKTQTVILTKESQLNQLDNIGSVLIYPSKVDTKSLIKAVQDKNLVINSIVEYDPDNAYTAKNLSDQGFPNGCYLVVDVTTKVEPTKIIGNFSLALQMGYRAATILNSSDYTKEELSQFSSAQIHVINRSLIKDDCFDDPEMLTSRNVALARDYTNVDDTLTEGAYVGVNKDTSGLGGGQAFGYSTNGKNFYSVITPKGIIFRQNDADRLWRLLKLTQRSDIESTVNDSVSKEIEAQKPLIDGAKEVAQTAVDTANQAIANSRVNSEAIININSAASAAKSDAQNATNIANAMKSSVTDQLKNLDSTSKELDNARSEMTQYAKTAQDQGKDIADLKKSTAEITADVANTKGDVAELKINASATAVMASNNKSDITQLQVTASNASIDLQNAKSDIASFNATANKINTSIKDQDNRISTVEQTAKGIQATIGNQQNDINTIKQEATGMKETITNNQKQLTEINTSVDGLSTKVAGAVGKDFVESSIKQANDKINESITSINGNIQNITADLNGVQATVKNKADVSQITQLTNLISTKVNQDDYKSAITQLGDDINARVQKGDLISQINLEAGQTLIQSKKLFLDADSVVFSGKAFIPDAAIANLSLDKLTTGHLTVPIADEYGNQIEMGNSGIDLISASEPINYASSGGTSNDKSTFRLNLSSSGISFTNRIEYGDTSPHNNKFDDYQFVNLQPDILHASDGDTDMVTIPSGMTMYIPVNYSSDLGPKSPGGFFALGHEITSEANGTDRGVDIAYVTKEINGWEMGLHVRTPMHILPPGADHGIRTTWVSWSNWDNGEKYPALVQEGSNWGGIAFPKSGRVTLFDANGRYYTPDRNTGIGPYNNYGGS